MKLKSALLVLLVGLPGVLCYAQQSGVGFKVAEQGFVFEEPPTPSCHASTLVTLGDGTMMAAWFGGTHESNKDVIILGALKTTRGWSKPVALADGRVNDTLRYPCWNPVLFRTREGLLFLHYKVGPNPRAWWAAMKVSEDDGKTWSAATRLPEGFLGPIKNKPVQLDDGSILYPSSTESLDERVWNIHLEISDARGKHWKKVKINCDTFGVIQPSILRHPGGKLQMLCRSRQQVIVETWSEDGGNTWSPLRGLTLPNPNSGSDAVTLPDGRHLLVYNPMTAGKNWWEGRSVLRVAVSPDGRQWTDFLTLEQQPEGEYSYPCIIEDGKGNVHIAYTSQRKRIRYVRLSPERP